MNIGPTLPPWLVNTLVQDIGDSQALKEPARKKRKLNDETVSSSVNEEKEVDVTLGSQKLHPKHPFKNCPPNFVQLAKKYKFFSKFVKIDKNGRGHVDFKNPNALLNLTKVILKDLYGFEFSMAINHLCPPVTQRLNYLLWANDLALGASEINFQFLGASKNLATNSSPTRAIDIGTGASCIFPLLGFGEFKWHWVASEIVQESIVSAQDNVNRNELSEFIKIRANTKDHIYQGIIQEGETFLVTVCNPPFHSSLEQTGHNKKRVLKAISSELVCEGGEVAFVSKMIEESLIFREQVGWFTTMLGKKSSLAPLREKLNSLNVQVFVFDTCFQQGMQSRWGLAWTFHSSLGTAHINKIKKKSTTKIRGKHELALTYTKTIWEDFVQACRKYGLEFQSEADMFILRASEIPNGFSFNCQGMQHKDEMIFEFKYKSGDFQLYEDLIRWVEKKLHR